MIVLNKSWNRNARNLVLEKVRLRLIEKWWKQRSEKEVGSIKQKRGCELGGTESGCRMRKICWWRIRRTSNERGRGDQLHKNIKASKALQHTATLCWNAQVNSSDSGRSQSWGEGYGGKRFRGLCGQELAVAVVPQAVPLSCKKSSMLGCKELGRWKVGGEEDLRGVWRINAMETQRRA